MKAVRDELFVHFIELFDERSDPPLRALELNKLRGFIQAPPVQRQYGKPMLCVDAGRSRWGDSVVLPGLGRILGNGFTCQDYLPGFAHPQARLLPPLTGSFCVTLLSSPFSSAC